MPIPRPADDLRRLPAERPYRRRIRAQMLSQLDHRSLPDESSCMNQPVAQSRGCVRWPPAQAGNRHWLQALGSAGNWGGLRQPGPLSEPARSLSGPDRPWVSALSVDHRTTRERSVQSHSRHHQPSAPRDRAAIAACHTTGQPVPAGFLTALADGAPAHTGPGRNTSAPPWPPSWPVGVSKTLRPWRSFCCPRPQVEPSPPLCEPPVYLSETSPDGKRRPRMAIAHTSEMLALLCEVAGQRGMTCARGLEGGLPGAETRF